MIGCSASTTVVSNSPVPWLLNWAPTSATYFGELRKQNEAQWIGAKPPAPFDVIEERLLLLGGDLVDVGVDQDGLVLRERLGVEVRDVLGVGHVDPAERQDGRDLRRPVGRLVVAAIAEEKNVDRSNLSLGVRRILRRGRDGQAEEGEEGVGHDVGLVA